MIFRLDFILKLGNSVLDLSIQQCDCSDRKWKLMPFPSTFDTMDITTWEHQSLVNFHLPVIFLSDKEGHLSQSYPILKDSRLRRSMSIDAAEPFTAQQNRARDLRKFAAESSHRIRSSCARLDLFDPHVPYFTYIRYSPDCLLTL